ARAFWKAWAANSPVGASTDGPPNELVAIRGDHRGRQWGPIAHVQFVGPQDKIVLSVTGNNPGENTALLMAVDSRQVLAAIAGADVWAVSPNGKLFAAGSFDGALQVYDLEAGKSLWNFDIFPGGGVRSLCFSPDSQTVA